MNAPDRFELFVLPDGVKKYAFPPFTPNGQAFVSGSAAVPQPVGAALRGQLHQFTMLPTYTNLLACFFFFYDIGWRSHQIQRSLTQQHSRSRRRTIPSPTCSGCKSLSPHHIHLPGIPPFNKPCALVPSSTTPLEKLFNSQHSPPISTWTNRQLLEDPKVLFAGYKMPHPLDHYFILKVQTTPDTNPAHVLGNAVTELIQCVGSMKNKFEMDLIRARSDASKVDNGEGEDLSSHQVDMDF